jgi:hypothetical protein
MILFSTPIFEDNRPPTNIANRGRDFLIIARFLNGGMCTIDLNATPQKPKNMMMN